MAPMIFAFAVISVLFPACIAQLTCLPTGGKSWCCPREGPDNRYLHEQQSNADQVLCNYGRGPIFTQCAYDASTGASVPPGPGCPLSAIKDPYEADFCPLTNVIHPNFNSKKCVTVPSYADEVKVKIRDCTGAVNQKFVFNQGLNYTQIQAAGTNFCLDVGPGPDPVPSVGTKVRVRMCNIGSDYQKWLHPVSNVIALDSKNRVMERVGNDVELREFDHDNNKQIWSTFP